MFISNMKPIREDDNSILIGDIQYIDLLDGIQTKEAAKQRITLTINNLPSERLSELQFSIGVSSELNAKTPVSFENTNVLSNNGEYWIG